LPKNRTTLGQQRKEKEKQPPKRKGKKNYKKDEFICNHQKGREHDRRADASLVDTWTGKVTPARGKESAKEFTSVGVPWEILREKKKCTRLCSAEARKKGKGDIKEKKRGGDF